MLLLIFAIATVVVVATPTARAQSRPAELSQVSRPGRNDSANFVRRAQRAQGDFESYRWAYLPDRYSPGGGECDAYIGRVCYWYDESKSEREPVPEPARIGRARAAFIARLDSIGAQVPGDDLIVGLRVWYRIEDQRAREAVDVAGECAAAPWWCSALRGLALHAAGDFAGSEQAFEQALSGMPEVERCKWTDMSGFLDYSVLDRYKKLRCAERARLEKRIWWLAQPMHSLGANDLRTEHLSRVTAGRILRRVRNTHNMRWGRDLENLLLRYGWSTWWTRDRASEMSNGFPRITGHSPVPAYDFFPSEAAVDSPTVAEPADWSLRNRMAVARYAPAYASPIVALPHQTALFRRGDSMLVVVRYDLRGDTLFMDRQLDAAVVLGYDERTPPAIARRRGSGSEVLLARTGHGDQLMSVEVLSVGARPAARARYALQPPDSATFAMLSEVMLFEAGDAPPPTLDAALGRMRPRDVLRANEQVGLLWEVYGVSGAIDVSVTLTRTAAGIRRRAAEVLQLRDKPTPLVVRWPDAARPGDDGIWTGTLVVDIGEKPAGTYRLDLTVRAADGRTATTSRTVEIVGK